MMESVDRAVSRTDKQVKGGAPRSLSAKVTRRRSRMRDGREKRGEVWIPTDWIQSKTRAAGILGSHAFSPPNSGARPFSSGFGACSSLSVTGVFRSSCDMSLAACILLLTLVSSKLPLYMQRFRSLLALLHAVASHSMDHRPLDPASKHCACTSPGMAVCRRPYRCCAGTSHADSSLEPGCLGNPPVAAAPLLSQVLGAIQQTRRYTVSHSSRRREGIILLKLRLDSILSFARATFTQSFETWLVDLDSIASSETPGKRIGSQLVERHPRPLRDWLDISG
jgi:hypothetical protein